jgi:hypothetical protein
LIGGLNALVAQLWCALGQSLALLAGVAIAVPWLGLRGAGVALAFSELCGSALLPILLCARLQPELMRALPPRALLLAALPCVVVAVSLLGAARGLLGAVGGIAVALGALGLLYWLQWSELGAPMQARLLVLIRPSRLKVGAP